jgi:hypothetical protein
LSFAFRLSTFALGLVVVQHFTQADPLLDAFGRPGVPAEDTWRERLGR